MIRVLQALLIVAIACGFAWFCWTLGDDAKLIYTERIRFKVGAGAALLAGAWFAWFVACGAKVRR